MTTPLRPSNENERLAALRRLKILDTDPEQSFDDLTKLASYICETPIAYISLVDEHRQWFKSRIGIQETETPRDIAFCAHAILESNVMVVADALEDPRFVNNPLVHKEPKIRFYAGALLRTADGFPVGTLCAVDTAPRTVTPEQQEALSSLARQASALLDLRQTIRELNASRDAIRSLSGLISICSTCKKIRDDDGNWMQLESYIQKKSDARFSHGVCPDCIELLYPTKPAP
ncbi:MAG: GAF domain-containing protein [Ignavibacteria bacterium]|nr:GAF domain-containing protein [Ignavibacteria bacterium]